MNVCPCCGQAVDTSKIIFSLDANAVAHNGQITRLEPQSAVIFSVLLKRYPGAVQSETLLQSLYGLNETVSRDPRKVLHVRMSRMRALLAPLGLGIETANGRGYRLHVD